MRNLATIGFAGPVWGVNPARREIHGRPCFPSIDDLPEPADAVVVAIPAADVPGVVRAAGRRGCRAAVVFAAGFAEAGAAELQAELVAAAPGMPIIGPNCDGMVAFHGAAALWGDVLVPRPPGRVALVSQSGNVAVNALALGRGLRWHTVASVGNQAVLDAAMLLEALAEEDEVGSVALFLEGDGDGARLATALARAAERDVGVAVLKVGATAAGATAAAAHTGALAGDQRVFRALVEEAGGAWAEDVHDLLELAKALAVPGARVRAGGRPAPSAATAPASGPTAPASGSTAPASGPPRPRPAPPRPRPAPPRPRPAPPRPRPAPPRPRPAPPHPGSPSSPARAATAGSPPTRPGGSACRSRRSARPRSSGSRSCCRPRRPPPTRSTTPR